MAGEATTAPPQRRVGKRPVALVAGLILATAYWISHQEQPPTDWQVLSWLMERYPEVSRASGQRYVSQARAMLRGPLSDRITSMRGEIITRVETIARNAKVEVKWRLKAEEQLAEMLGLNAPKQVEVATVHLQAGQSLKGIDWTAYEQHCRVNQAATPALPSVPMLDAGPSIIVSSEVKQLPPVNVPPSDAANGLPAQ